MAIDQVNSKFLDPFGYAFRNGPMAEWFKDRRPGIIRPELSEPMADIAKIGLAFINDELLADGKLSASL